VQAFFGPRELGTTRLLGQPVEVGFGKAESIGDHPHGRVIAVDVDPEQLAVTELRDIDLRQVDFTVVAVGVE
jgi:hypothetical protein